MRYAICEKVTENDTQESAGACKRKTNCKVNLQSGHYYLGDIAHYTTGITTTTTTTTTTAALTNT
jgi:hypothetical protein